MSFERTRGRGYAPPEPPRRIEHKPTQEEERQRARVVAGGLERVRSLVEHDLEMLAGARTLPEWQSARHQLDVRLQNLSSLVREAAGCQHVDAVTTARLRDGRAAYDDLLRQARAHGKPPAFPPPQVSCEAALLQTLPQAAAPQGAIKQFFDEAEGHVSGVLATVSPREAATVGRRLQNPADPLGERFARFGAERRRRLLGFLRSRRRQLAAESTRARVDLESGRPAEPAPEPAQGATAAAEPTREGATADGQASAAMMQGSGTREPEPTAARAERAESLEGIEEIDAAAEPERELAPREATDHGAAMDRATAGSATEVPHRRAMERAFGQDFGGVRAHVGQPAPLSAMNAQAAARGEEVAFASSSPDPPLVAHELTHVVQNRRARSGITAGSVAAKRVDSGDSSAEREADAIAHRVAEHGLGMRLPVSASPDAEVHRGPPSAAAAVNEPSGPLGAFAAAAREAGVTLEPARVILNDRFSPAPEVVATIATTVGPPAEADGAQAAIDVKWTLLDPGREVLWQEATPWYVGDARAVPTTFRPERGGPHTVRADLIRGSVRLVRLERGLDVEQPASDLAAATMLGEDERAAEFERERASLADATLSRQRRKDLGNERALIEFGAHRAGQKLDRPLEPPADAIEFEGLRMSSDPAFLRSLVEDRFIRNGYAGAWAFIHDIFGQKLQAKLNKVALEERPRVQREGAAIIRGMEAQLELLRTDNEIFLAEYQATAEHVVKHTLDESEKRTQAEIDRYGLRRETANTVVAEETGKTSWRRVPGTRTDYVGATNDHSRELARAAGELAAAQREIDRMRERADEAKRVLASRKLDLEEGLHDQGTTPDSVAEQEGLSAALDRQTAAAEKAHQAAAARREQEFPVLATFRKVEDKRVTFDIDALTRMGHPQAGAAELGPRLFATLDSIARTREALKGGTISLWTEDRVHQLTVPQMLVVPGTVRERALKDRIAAEKGGSWADFAILALTVGLALVAAIPTGGSSLAAGVVVAAEVAGGVLEVYLAIDRVQKFGVDSAKARTDMDRARALARDEPSLVWLALDLVLSAAGAATASRAVTRHFDDLTRARRLGLDAAGAPDQVQRALDTIHAERRAGHVSAEAADKLEDEILAANGMPRGKDVAGDRLPDGPDRRGPSHEPHAADAGTGKSAITPEPRERAAPDDHASREIAKKESLTTEPDRAAADDAAEKAGDGADKAAETAKRVTRDAGEAGTPKRESISDRRRSEPMTSPAVRDMLAQRIGATVELDPDIGSAVVIRQSDAEPANITVRVGPEAKADHVLAQREKIQALKKPAKVDAANTTKRINEPVEGLYEAVEPDHVPDGWTILDSINPRPDGTIEMRTTITGPNGAAGRMTRVYDPNTNTLMMKAAFFDDELPRWISTGKPMVEAKGGTPTFAYMQMRQMRKLGVDRSGLKKVHMSTIVNTRTILEVSRARKAGLPLDQEILNSHSVQYAETALVQSGHRIRKARVTGGDELPISRVLDPETGPNADKIKKANDELLNEHGLERTDIALWGFDIDLELMPWQ
jgi:hypothetical protein